MNCIFSNKVSFQNWIYIFEWKNLFKIELKKKIEKNKTSISDNTVIVIFIPQLRRINKYIHLLWSQLL